MSKCCKAPCGWGRTSNTFVSRNLTKSKLPKWCRNKVPLAEDPLESAYGIPESPFNPDGTLKSVCEPPPLTDSELKAVWALKSLKKKADDRVKQTAGQTEHLKERLHNIKKEIETISQKLEHPHFDPLDFGETEEDENSNIVVYAKEHLRLQRDLLECFDTEKQLQEELAHAQRDHWKAVTEKELLKVEEEKVKPTLLYYQKQQSFKAKKRAICEKQLRQNAIKTRNQALSNVVTSLKTSYASHKKAIESAKNVKLQTAKISRWRVQPHLKKTMGTKHDKEVQQACDQQYYQGRKYVMLRRLKKEIASQKRNLIAVHEAKEKKRAAEAEKDQAVHDYIQQSGTNPYVVERLVAMEKRYNEQRKKIIDKEHERLAQLHRDFEIIEKSTQREEKQKKKWEQIWAKRFEERKKAEKAKKMKFLYSGPKEPVEEAKPVEEEEEAVIEEAEEQEQSIVSQESTKPEKIKPKKKSKKVRSNRSSRIDEGESVVSESHKTRVRKSKKKTRDSKKMKHNTSTDSIKEHEQDFFYADDSLSVPASLRTSETVGEFGDIIPSSQTSSKKTLTLDEAAALLQEHHDIVSSAVTDEKKLSTGERQKTSLSKAKPKKSVGPFFKWTPEVVLFTDYVVGRTYRQTISITNVSIQRMKFVMKELIDDKVNIEPGDPPLLQNFMKAKFTVSKMMSPGVVHDMVLVFTPKVSADWSGTLYFESNEDPFQIRVECWRERFLPSLSSTRITFENTVVNVAGILPVTIKNAGSKRGAISRIFQKNALLYEDSEFLTTENEEEEDDDTLSLASYATVIDNTNPTPQHVSVGETIINDAAPKPSPKIKQKLKPRAKSTGAALTLLRTSRSKSTTSIKSGSQSKKKGKKEKVTPRSGKGSRSNSAAKRRIEAERDCRSILKDIIFSVTTNIFFSYVKEGNRVLDKDKARKICVIFRPPYIGVFKTTFQVEFEDKEIPNLEFDVYGNSTSNPITIEPANSDLRICFMGHYYQQMLAVTTSVKGAGKVTPVVPPELKSFVKVVPKEATVLAKTPAHFCVKFHPSPSMLQEHNPIAKYFDRETKLIDFPVHFKLKFPFKVDSPLTTTFLAVVTDHRLQFIPQELEMGKCSSNESVQASFMIYNDSLLPQHIGFVDLPEFISIQPNFGFATLLPHEKKEFQLLLSLPENASGNLTYKVKCQSWEKQKAVLKVKVNARINHVHLSSSRILFPVTPIGTTTSAAIELFSTASPDLTRLQDPPKTKFQFLIPPNSPVNILPKAGYITWEKSQNLLVQFTPTVDDQQVKLHAVEMLERQHIHTLALWQRELDGIEHAIINHNKFGGEDYEMFEEHNEIDMGIGPYFLTMPADRSSFIKPAVAPSDLKVEIKKPVSSASIRPELIGTDKKKESKRGSSKRNSTSSNKSAGSTKQKEKKSLTKKSRTSIASSVQSGRSGKKKKRSGPLSHPHMSSHHILSEEQKVMKDLKTRKKELIRLLSTPYEPPNPDSIALGTSEYIKATRDYLTKVKVSCTALKIPCFITHPNEEKDVLMLYCKCPASPPSVILVEETPEVDFESTVLGSRVHKELHFHNISQSTLTLKMDPFNPYGPFTQCNAARRVPPNYVYTLRLRFSPISTDPVTESVWGSMGKDKVLVTFKGESEIPNFTVAPADTDYFMGTVDVGQYLYQEFAVHNGNKSRLKFAMTLIDQKECDTSTEEGKRLSSFFSEEFVHLASDPRHSTTLDGESSEYQETVRSSGPPPPTPDPKYKPQKTHRKGSRSTREESAVASSTGKRRSTMKKSSRSSLQTSAGSENPKQSDTLSPSLPSTPDMLHEIQTSDGTILSLSIHDLVQHLKSNGRKYYFYCTPPVLPIPGGKTRLFRVCFIPADQGQFYSHFELSLEGKPIQDFHFYGTGKLHELDPLLHPSKHLTFRNTINQRSFQVSPPGPEADDDDVEE